MFGFNHLAKRLEKVEQEVTTLHLELVTLQCKLQQAQCEHLYKHRAIVIGPIFNGQQYYYEKCNYCEKVFYDKRLYPDTKKNMTKRQLEIKQLQIEELEKEIKENENESSNHR